MRVCNASQDAFDGHLIREVYEVCDGCCFPVE